MNDRNVFLAVLEADQSRIRAPAGVVSGDSLLSVFFLPASYVAEGVRELSGF